MSGKIMLVLFISD